MSHPVKVLVVDDSPLFAEAICRILQGDPELFVVGVAGDGREAVEMTRRLRPDVITMDVQMPVMDGLEAIEHIMARTPTPVLVVTGDPRARGEEMLYEALRRGALDVMAKPGGWQVPLDQQQLLRDKVRFLAGVTVIRHMGGGPLRRARLGRGSSGQLRVQPPARRARLPWAGPGRPAGACPRAVGIVASTGGPAALASVLEALPGDLPAAILVVQHIARGFCSSLASWLDDVAELNVRLASDGEPLQPGTVLLAVDGCHTRVERGGVVRLMDAPPLDGYRPSGTILLGSLAEAYGRQALGVILTGMGRDGVSGLLEVKTRGGVTLAQDEASSVVFGMPKVALESGAAQRELPLSEIPQAICELVGLERVRRAEG